MKMTPSWHVMSVRASPGTKDWLYTSHRAHNIGCTRLTGHTTLAVHVSPGTQHWLYTSHRAHNTGCTRFTGYTTLAVHISPGTQQWLYTSHRAHNTGCSRLTGHNQYATQGALLRSKKTLDDDHVKVPSSSLPLNWTHSCH